MSSGLKSAPTWEPPAFEPLKGVNWRQPFDDPELERAAQYFVGQVKRMCANPACQVCLEREAEVRRRVWNIYDHGVFQGIAGDAPAKQE